MNKPRLLDLFCGAGGCAKGYQRAGFYVVGVDNRPQPRYCGDEFIQADAMTFPLEGFDVIHASPPCQAYTVAKYIHGSADRYPDLVDAIRERLLQDGKPWVIENVNGAPLRFARMLCGQMFGLGVIRHRYFESSELLCRLPHRKHPKDKTTGTMTAKRGGKGNGYSTGEHGLVCVAGNNFVREAGAAAMGIDWMQTRQELANAIPPAYTEYIGKQLIERLSQELHKEKP